MAIIRNTASMMLKGKVGATTFYVAESRQLARQAMNNSNYGQNASRTDLQQARRVKWSNLVNFYSANKGWMKKAYEDLKPGVSIFNRFMQLNINSAQVALTKSEAQAKVWIPSVYRVTQGSLAPLSYVEYEDSIGLSLNLGFESVEGVTVGAFSQKIIQENPAFQNGDAIAAVAFFGTDAVPGSLQGFVPGSYLYEEFVLDTASTEQMEAKYPKWRMSDEYTTCSIMSAAMGGAYIHTRKSAGKLYVSTQDIVLNTFYVKNGAAWRDNSQFVKAIASYGESTTVPLAPGGQGSLGSGNDSSTGGGSNPGEDGGGSLG